MSQRQIIRCLTNCFDAPLSLRKIARSDAARTRRFDGRVGNIVSYVFKDQMLHGVEFVSKNGRSRILHFARHTEAAENFVRTGQYVTVSAYRAGGIWIFCDE